MFRARRTRSGHYSVSSDEGATSDSSAGSVGRAMFGIHDLQPAGIAAVATVHGLADAGGRLRHASGAAGMPADASAGAGGGVGVNGGGASDAHGAAAGSAVDNGAGVTAADVELRVSGQDKPHRSARARHHLPLPASQRGRAGFGAPTGVPLSPPGVGDAGTGSTGAARARSNGNLLAAAAAAAEDQTQGPASPPFAGARSSATGVAGLTFKVGGGAPSPLRVAPLGSPATGVGGPANAVLVRSSSRRGRRSAPSFGRFRQSQSLESLTSVHGPTGHAGAAGTDAPPGPESDAGTRSAPGAHALAAAFSIEGSRTMSADTDANSATSDKRSVGSVDSADSGYSERVRSRRRRRRERPRGDSARSRERDSSTRMRYGMARSLSLRRSNTGGRSIDLSVGAGEGSADRDDRYDRHHGSLRTSRSRDSGAGSTGTGSVGGSIGRWECGPELLEWLLDPLDITVLDRIAGTLPPPPRAVVWRGQQLAVRGGSFTC